MQDWMMREEKFAALFSPDTLQTRYFQRLKLDHFRDVARQLRADANKDERMTLRILRGEMKSLEKKLYPRAVTRMFMRVLRSMKKKDHTAEPTSWILKVDSKVLKAAPAMQRSRRPAEAVPLKQVNASKKIRPH